MKKGFTLVELIGVMVILGLMVLVGVPAMTRTLRNTNEDEYNRALTDLYLATENYIEVNRSNFPTLNEAGGEVYISLNELKNAGYLRANITNPKTEKVFDYKNAVRVFRNLDGTLDYEYNTNYYGVDGYASDGLIVQFDALNNSGIGKYNANTDTWKDLSGNDKDGVIYNATWNSNNLSFDGDNDYIDMGNKLNDLFKSSMTLELVIKFDQNSDRAIILGNYDNSNSINIEQLTTSKARIYYNSGTIDSHTSDGFHELGLLENYSYLLNKDTNTFYFYKNSEKNLQRTISAFAENYDFPNAKIGKDNRLAPGNTYLEGEIYAIRIYNRALTEAEISHNYEVDKLRFNMN